MRRIEAFLKNLNRARKRVGVVYANEDFETVLSYCLTHGYKLVDATNSPTNSLFLTDDSLIAKTKEGSNDSKILHIGLELFIAPRLSEDGFVAQLIKKLAAEEPSNAVVILLYSRKLFHSFAKIYTSTQQNQVNVLDITAEQQVENEEA